MKGFIVFMFFHFIGGTALGLGTIGFGINLLCYLCNKALLFDNNILAILTISGAIIEFIGFAFSVLSLKGGK